MFAPSVRFDPLRTLACLRQSLPEWVGSDRLIVQIAALLSMQSIYEMDLSDARMIHSPSVNSKGYPISEQCSEWTAARKRKNRRAAVLEAWVTGVITGYNLYHPKSDTDALDLLNGNNWGKELSGVFVSLDQRCARTPLASFPIVTRDLIDDLRKR